MRSFCLIALLVLTGCHAQLAASQGSAINDMTASKAAYKNCLATKGNCAAEKAAYEADVSAYNTLRGTTVLH